MNKKEYYTVIMRKFGESETHAYPIGIFKSKHKARVAGLAEEYYRGGKYTAEINVFELDDIETESVKYLNDSCGGYDEKKGNAIEIIKWGK